MASYIIKLASAGPNAIQTALQYQPLSPQCKQELQRLAQSVAKAPKVLQEKTKPTPELIFNNHILPRLKKVIEDHAVNPEDFTLSDVDLRFEDVSNYNRDQLVHRHKNLIRSEDSLKASILCIRYQRGLIYQRAHKVILEFDELKKWLFDNFRIAYSTASAYINVSILIQSYPLLIKTGLSFDQLRSHAGRIRKFAKVNIGMAERCAVLTSAGDEVGVINVVDDGDIKILDKVPRGADLDFYEGQEETQEDFPHFDSLCEEEYEDTYEEL